MTTKHEVWKSKRGFTFETEELARLDDTACALRDAFDRFDDAAKYERRIYRDEGYSTLEVAYMIAKKSPMTAEKITLMLEEYWNG